MINSETNVRTVERASLAMLKALRADLDFGGVKDGEQRAILTVAALVHAVDRLGPGPFGPVMQQSIADALKRSRDTGVIGAVRHMIERLVCGLSGDPLRAAAALLEAADSVAGYVILALDGHGSAGFCSNIPTPEILMLLDEAKRTIRETAPP